MLFTLIDIFILLFAINNYKKRKLYLVLVCIAYFASDAFLISFGMSPIIKHKDIGLLLIFYCCWKGNKDKDFFKVNHDIGGKLNRIFLIFIALEFCYSILFSEDSIANNITVLRDYLYVLSYFVIRQCKNDDLLRAAKTTVRFVVFSCVLFVIQFFTHVSLVGTYIGGGEMDVYRMQVTPAYIEFLFLYLMCFGKNTWSKWVIIVFITSVLLISLNRTAIIGLCFQVGVFFLFSKNVRRKVLILILALLLYPIVAQVFETRDSAREEYITSNQAMSYIKSRDFAGLASTNNFYFRVGCIAERVDYLLHNSDKTLLGVGAIHEQSRIADKYSFSTGTIKRYKGYAEHSQFDTIDTTWSPIIIRYGFIGLIVFVSYLICSMLSFYKCSTDSIMMIGWILLLGVLLQSISGGVFFMPFWLLQYCFLQAYRRNYLLNLKS